MPLDDIIGHPQGLMEYSTARGNTGVLVDIVSKGLDISEIPAVTGGGGLTSYGSGSS